MISRRTALLISRAIEVSFRTVKSLPDGHGYYSDRKAVYDFFFENDYPAWLCNAAKNACSHTQTTPLKEFVMKLHTGESVQAATPSWSWLEREKLGQQYLEGLAEDIVKYWDNAAIQYGRNTVTPILTECRQSLELDGCEFKEGRLLASEVDVLDVKEDMVVLESLYSELNLLNKDTAFHHLELSEEHYLAKKWDDSISNSRKFLEGVLQEVAAAHYQGCNKNAIPDAIYSHPAEVRKYLEKVGLVETKEKEAIASIYGLLSHTGSHPYMSENDQARLLRHLALTVSQFIMLRLKGTLITSP